MDAHAEAHHECRHEQLLSYQVRLARAELTHCLEARVAAWERDPALARRVAFARYVRDHGAQPLPARSRARRAA